MNDNNNTEDFQTYSKDPDGKADHEEESYREEVSSEYTPNPGLLGGRGPVEITSDRTREETREDAGHENAGKGVGSLGIALSVVSLFFMPVILAIAGIIAGVAAVRKDHKGIGYTAIGIGAFSLIISLFFAPFAVW